MLPQEDSNPLNGEKKRDGISMKRDHDSSISTSSLEQPVSKKIKPTAYAEEHSLVSSNDNIQTTLMRTTTMMNTIQNLNHKDSKLMMDELNSLQTHIQRQISTLSLHIRKQGWNAQFLPIDLIVLILSYLPLHDMFKVRSVCSLFMEGFEKQETISTRSNGPILTMTPSKELTIHNVMYMDRMAECFLRPHLERIQKLTVNNCAYLDDSSRLYTTYDYRDPNKFLNPILNGACNLESVTISASTWLSVSVLNLLGHNSSLRYLNVKCSPSTMVYIPDSCTEVICNTTLLRHLLHLERPLAWINYGLKKLTVTGTVYSMEVRGLLAPFKSLEELRIRVVIRKDTDVETLAKYLPVSLHYLKIKTKCNALSKSEIESIIRRNCQHHIRTIRVHVGE